MPTGYAPPVPSGLTKRGVQNIAEHIARQLEYAPGSQLLPVVEKLGGKMQYEDFAGLRETDSGSLIVHDENNFEIKVATSTSVSRDQFTIAHEIGHYMLHYLYHKQHGQLKSQGMVANRYGSDRSEWEANWFAAAFLMPEDAFRSTFTAVGGDINDVSAKFAVSYTAAEVRAKSLGLA